MSKWIFSWLIILSPLFTFAQEYVEISKISFSGNKRTKEKVIRNEINFTEGDKILNSDFEKLISDNENRLKSIGLFNTAQIEVKSTEDLQTIINVELVENWYLYPSPIFELGDRSFNAWWQEQNRDLKRINYGVRGRH